MFFAGVGLTGFVTVAFEHEGYGLLHVVHEFVKRAALAHRAWHLHTFSRVPAALSVLVYDDGIFHVSRWLVRLQSY